jgi:hypothetical protein
MRWAGWHTARSSSSTTSARLRQPADVELMFTEEPHASRHAPRAPRAPARAAPRADRRRKLTAVRAAARAVLVTSHHQHGARRHAAFHSRPPVDGCGCPYSLVP